MYSKFCVSVLTVSVSVFLLFLSPFCFRADIEGKESILTFTLSLAYIFPESGPREALFVVFSSVDFRKITAAREAPTLRTGMYQRTILNLEENEIRL